MKKGEGDVTSEMGIQPVTPDNSEDEASDDESDSEPAQRSNGSGKGQMKRNDHAENLHTVNHSHRKQLHGQHVRCIVNMRRTLSFH